MNFSKEIFILLSSTCFSVSAIVPPGYYYTANGLKKAELKSALHSIVSKASMLSYGSGDHKTWSGFQKTDCKDENIVYDMYSDSVRYFSNFSSVEGMHIEHSLPKSWWGSYENNAYKDLFHLYPSDGIANSTKNNLPLGECSDYTFYNGESKIGINNFGQEYTGKCFEPSDQYKGDFARSYLYMSTAYEDFYPYWNSPMMNNNTYPVWNQWSIDLLLKWHREDPVSDKELKRQEAVYEIQGNRNPYIDYPDLIEYIWGKDTINTYEFPKDDNPFFITPNRWNRLNIGTLLLNDHKQLSLPIKTKNFLKSIKVKLSDANKNLIVNSELIPSNESNKGYDLLVDFDACELGDIRDTLFLISEEMNDTLRIPIKGLVAADFVLLPASEVTSTSAVLNWMKVPNLDYFEIDLYEGDQQAGDLFISKYIEGTSWNKALEIYNGRKDTVDLSHYSLKLQTDGNGSFYREQVLQGKLPPNQCFLLTVNDFDLGSSSSKADMIVPHDGILSFNGNDAIALYRNGIQIDVVGEVNNMNFWGTDMTLVRKSYVTHPNCVFNWNEWEVKEVNNIDNLKIHQAQFVNNPNYLLYHQEVGNNISYSIRNLRPNTLYTYNVNAVLKDQTTLPSALTMQFATNTLEIPNILNATNISFNSFIINWEESLDADHYLLDLYTCKELNEMSEIETFDNIKNGKPLPIGWTGSASGHYESTTSSGANPNAIGFKNENEWLQTKEYASSVKELTFMYRFPTNSIGNYLILKGIANGNRTVIDTLFFTSTKKTIANYSFTSNENYTSFRFIFGKKISSNLALDDVKVVYSNMEKEYICKQIPVFGNEYQALNLNPTTTYYYTISSVLDDVCSMPSTVEKTTTKVLSNIDKIQIKASEISIEDQFLRIKCYSNKFIIKIFNLNGLLIYNKSYLNNEQVQINFPHSGIYIVQVITSKGQEFFKIKK